MTRVQPGPRTFGGVTTRALSQLQHARHAFQRRLGIGADGNSTIFRRFSLGGASFAPAGGMKPLLKFALWGGSFGAAAVLVQRMLQRRRQRRIDVGPVSDDWLARRRGITEQLPY
jgi:hypothetical protein